MLVVAWDSGKKMHTNYSNSNVGGGERSSEEGEGGEGGLKKGIFHTSNEFFCECVFPSNLKT